MTTDTGEEGLESLIVVDVIGQLPKAAISMAYDPQASGGLYAARGYDILNLPYPTGSLTFAPQQPPQD